MVGVLAVHDPHGTAAEELFIHRGTLRYRLNRIQLISGLDLNDPETVLNLQLATRAQQTLAAFADE